MHLILRKHGYRHSALKRLSEESLASPEDILRRVDRIEALLGELDFRQVYRLEDLYRRITDRTPGHDRGVRIPGRDARFDLMLLVEDLSDRAALPVQAVPERVLSVDALAKELRVSTKTISRWRRQGLVSRRFLFDNRRQVGFLESSVQRFIAGNRQRVERGARFSQMTPEERESILEQAKRLAAIGTGPATVIKTLSTASRRSGETIRSMLKRFDREHPDQPLFPDYFGQLRPETKRRILQCHEQGETVDALARRFCRGRASISRAISQARAERIAELPLDFIANPQFAAVKTKREERQLLSEGPVGEKSGSHRKAPRDLPPYLAGLYEIPLLTRAQEEHLFRKMNYLKYKAGRLRAKLDPARPNTSLMGRIERLSRQAVAVKNQIVSANLRLVVSIAKRHAAQGQEFFELVSDGNVSLMRAVEKFDFARGFKFSTYASWAIMKNFSRSIPDEQHRRRRYSTGANDALAMTEDVRTDQHDVEARHEQHRAAVERILRRLDAREQVIVTRRFGLHGEERLTLKQVGRLIGVTKERARQLEARAISKLRRAAVEERLPLEEWTQSAEA